MIDKVIEPAVTNSAELQPDNAIGYIDKQEEAIPDFLQYEMKLQQTSERYKVVLLDVIVFTINVKLCF